MRAYIAIAYGIWALLIAVPSVLASYGLALKGGFAIFALLQLLLIIGARVAGPHYWGPAL